MSMRTPKKRNGESGPSLPNPMAGDVGKYCEMTGEQNSLMPTFVF
jgi:hypothetical protein